MSTNQITHESSIEARQILISQKSFHFSHLSGRSFLNLLLPSTPLSSLLLSSSVRRYAPNSSPTNVLNSKKKKFQSLYHQSIHTLYLNCSSPYPNVSILIHKPINHQTINSKSHAMQRYIHPIQSIHHPSSQGPQYRVIKKKAH